MPRDCYILTWSKSLLETLPALKEITQSVNVFALLDNAKKLLSLSQTDSSLTSSLPETLNFIRLIFPQRIFGNTEQLLHERAYFAPRYPWYLPGNLGNALYWRRTLESPLYSIAKNIAAQARSIKRALRIKFFDPYDPYYHEHYHAECMANLTPRIESSSPYARIKYLTPAEREKYRLLVVDQRLFTLSSTGDQLGLFALNTKDNSDYMVVMNLKGEIFAGVKTPYGLQHSCFERAQPVLFAGYLKTDSTGKLLHVQSHSGHYSPTRESLYVFMRHLEARDCDLTRVSLEQITRIKPGATDDCLRKERLNLEDLFGGITPPPEFYRDVLPLGSLILR